MQRFGFTLACLFSFAVVGCEKKAETVTTIRVVETQPAVPRTAPVSSTRTFETDELRESISRYIAVPSAENSAEVQKSFAELDVEIAELQEDVLKETDPEDKAEAAVKLRDLTAYREAERLRFSGAQTVAVPVAEEPRARDVGHEIKEELKDVGRDIKDELKEVVR